MCISSVLNMYNCNWYIYIDKEHSFLASYGLQTKIRLDAWSLIRIEYEENCRCGSVGTEFASHSVDLVVKTRSDSSTAKRLETCVSVRDP